MSGCSVSHKTALTQTQVQLCPKNFNRRYIPPQPLACLYRKARGRRKSEGNSCENVSRKGLTPATYLSAALLFTATAIAWQKQCLDKCSEQMHRNTKYGPVPPYHSEHVVLILGFSNICILYIIFWFLVYFPCFSFPGWFSRSTSLNLDQILHILHQISLYLFPDILPAFYFQYIVDSSERFEVQILLK